MRRLTSKTVFVAFIAARFFAASPIKRSSTPTPTTPVTRTLASGRTRRARYKIASLPHPIKSQVLSRPTNPTNLDLGTAATTMTLYYSLVFILLMLEMTLFVVLIIPLPFPIKRRVFTFISENPIVAKIQYWMKICFIFILILFVDSVNRVYRVQVELAAVQESSGKNAAAVLGHERLEVQARKFYSQRNMYLCGFTLFLSLILNRTYVMILDVMRLEDKVRAYEGTTKGDKQSEKLAMAGKPGEIARLKGELEKKDLELETLKKQAAGLHREYDSLADKYATTQERIPKKDA